MIEFAKIYEEWNNYYGYNFDELAHDSLEDVKATLVVYNALKKNCRHMCGCKRSC